MTCIVAVETQDGRCLVGTDSFVGTDTSYGVIDRPKLHTSGCVTMAFAGSIRVPQIIAAHVKFPAKVPDDPSAMVHGFADKIREALNDHGAKQDDTDAMNLLICVGGRLYTIYGDFAVLRLSCGYQALGAGETFALGALHAMSKRKRASKAGVLAALKAAEAHSPYVRGPFWVQEV